MKLDLEKMIDIKPLGEFHVADGSKWPYVRKVDEVEVKEWRDPPRYEQNYEVTLCYKTVVRVGTDVHEDGLYKMNDAVHAAAKEMKQHIYGEIAKELRRIYGTIRNADNLHDALFAALDLLNVISELER